MCGTLRYMETARFAQYVVAIIARCNVQGTARYRVKGTVRYRTLLRHQRALAQDFRPGCPDIRQIVHISVPDDIGCYIQETGRAGQRWFVVCANSSSLSSLP